MVQLATCIQVIGLLQHLYTPNILILISRILVQVQIANAALLHPTRSLFQLFFLLTATNLAAVLLHALDFVAGMAGGKGVLLDFVRQGGSTTACFTATWEIRLTFVLSSSPSIHDPCTPP